MPNNYNTYNAQPSVAIEVNLGEDIYLNSSKSSMIFRMEVHFTENWGSSIRSKQSDSLFFKYNAHFLSVNPQLLFNVYNSNNCDINLGAGLEMYFWSRGYETFAVNNYQNITVPGYYEGYFTFTTTANVILNKKFDFNAGYDPVSTIGQKNNTLSALHLGINYLFGKNQ